VIVNVPNYHVIDALATTTVHVWSWSSSWRCSW